MKQIAILGCGPTGLTLAQSLRWFGKEFGLKHEIKIFSRKEPSYIAGAQYLHEPVPGISRDAAADTLIGVRKRGTREGYAQKVYGRPDAPVSWDRYDPTLYEAWNMREAYTRLWEAWESAVVPVDLTPVHSAQAASDGVLEGYEPDVVLNTVPLSALCLRNGGSRMAEGPEHMFARQKVHVQQTEGAFPEDHPSEIIYNGEPEPSWYRKSVIFGTVAVEWSAQGPKPPIDNVVTITKPVATNCDCFEDVSVPWFNVGRYGAYDKNYLSHHAINVGRELALSLRRDGASAVG